MKGTVLIFARDPKDVDGHPNMAKDAWSGLNGYAIPYEVVLVPKAGITLPTFSEGTQGNYGAIVVLSEVSYNYGTTEASSYKSALTDAQWAEIYDYQVNYGVRLVRLDVAPGPATGTESLGGCCAEGQEQSITITDTKEFSTSGLKT